MKQSLFCLLSVLISTGLLLTSPVSVSLFFRAYSLQGPCMVQCVGSDVHCLNRLWILRWNNDELETGNVLFIIFIMFHQGRRRHTRSRVHFFHQLHRGGGSAVKIHPRYCANHVWGGCWFVLLLHADCNLSRGVQHWEIGRVPEYLRCLSEFPLQSAGRIPLH